MVEITLNSVIYSSYARYILLEYIYFCILAAFYCEVFPNAVIALIYN